MATQGDLQQVIQEANNLPAVPDTGPPNTPTDGPAGQDAQIPNGADPATTGPAPAVNPMLQPPPPILHP